MFTFVWAILSGEYDDEQLDFLRLTFKHLGLEGDFGWWKQASHLCWETYMLSLAKYRSTPQ
jgi:hypothetical protein